MKDEEEQPIAENRLPCGVILLINLGIWALIIFGCIKMCH